MLNWIKYGIPAAIVIALGIYIASINAENTRLKKQIADDAEIAEQQLKSVLKENARLNKQYEELKNAQTNLLQDAANNAVINYRVRNPDFVCVASSFNTMPGKTESNAGNDEASAQRLATSETFIEDCATDAAIVGLFQQIAIENHFRIGD